jgi:hypothetical protein
MQLHPLHEAIPTISLTASYQQNIYCNSVFDRQFRITLSFLQDSSSKRTGNNQMSSESADFVTQLDIF